jgi:hypothetical protein
MSGTEPTDSTPAIPEPTSAEPTGTDALFPGATAHPAAAVPTAPAPAVVTSTPVAPSGPRRGIGVAAFVLGLLAMLGDLIAIVLAFIALAGAISNLGATLDDPAHSLGSAIGVLIIIAIAFFGGMLFALLAVILGLVAAIRNRGRVLGVFGVIFGLLILIGHIGVIIAAATSGNGMPS